MKRIVVLLLACLFGVMACAYEPPAPTREVETVRYEWNDTGRNRAVPAKLYFPKEGDGPWPVIIFSHGLGGSREHYEYLGRYWAGCGYVSVHLQHLGSDDAVWKGAGADMPRAMLKSAMDVRNAIDRPRDVSFAIDQLSKLNADPGFPLHGRLNLAAIGVAGHSFGGHTTMVVAGQSLAGLRTNVADPRVRCAVQMSAPVAWPGGREKTYASVRIPVFHLTGTKDDSPIGDTRASERRIPFDLMTGAETALVIFKDGDHMIFSGRPLVGDKARAAQDTAFQKLICLGTTAFWDAWLKGDSAAHAWFMDGGFAAALDGAGTFEKKVPAK